MDQKRLFIWIAVSIAILLGFQYVGKRFAPPPSPAPAAVTPGSKPLNQSMGAGPAPAAPPTAVTVAANAPRVAIDAPRVQGSIDLVGATFDDLVLKDYHETLDKRSPLVLLFAPEGAPQPYFAQFGWSAAPGATIAVPDGATKWSASAGPLSATSPVTLSWDNGSGLTYQLVVSIDANYMFAVRQLVVNHTAAAVALYPWSRIRRESPKDQTGTYTLFGQQRAVQKLTNGNYVLFEGMLGVLGGTLHEEKYSAALKSGSANQGLASELATTGGWIGITDKYWLAALIPDQAANETASFRGDEFNNADGYQVDLAATAPLTVPPGATTATTTRMFAGAKVVRLLDGYQSQYGIPLFWKAVDFGMFFFITRPFFFAIDWLYHLIGNFGLAIMVFTVILKLAFFPIANRQYRSMAKMRDVGPKMAALKERYKEEPAKLQTETLALYKREGVNPASGCLPIVIQIPVFFSLYKVIYTTIEMRQAPFFGWVHDLSVVDPTNVFNLFGLIPFDPTTLNPVLHLGVWPLILGVTMFLQQKLNPPPPDPMQARLFQLMPIMFTFMMARFPAGLVIYWSWSNLLTAAQQWTIMRTSRKAAKIVS